MDSPDRAEPDSSSRTPSPRLSLVWIPILMGVALVLAYAAYFGLIRAAPPGNPDSWGQFGDFVGGLLNPMVGIITIVLLVRTLHSQQAAIKLQSTELAMQRRELELQRKETAKSTAALDAQHKAIVIQSFEQTFFAWLDSYRTLVVNLTDSEGQRIGAKRLLALSRKFNGNRVWKILDPRRRVLVDDSTPLTDYPQAIANYLADQNSSLVVERYHRSIQSYLATYADSHSELGPILRTLYRLIEWVDKAPITTASKWHYVAIVRSQLSWAEMYILAINGCTSRGANFVRLIEKYALFDNLESESDGIVKAMREAFLQKPPSDFPYTLNAFSSIHAKIELGLVEAKDL